MAANVSQAFSKSKEQFRDGDGDEDDGEEVLDPRVKGELDRLNSSTAEINRLEQDLEELRAAFRQTLTESAYVLKSQSAFLGNCVKNARPYHDAVRKAKQSQVDTQKAALKYERACSSHQAAKKVLAIAEQKLVSTSKEHKILDPTWQDMLNQAVLKVMEGDKERALSEKEHLETAQAFSEAGSKVTELRAKLKSSINKSRPYFDLKMKYDQILQAHKRQVEITQEGLQEAKQKYSLALKNLEGISEEIHEMRKSRDSLDTILTEREEGVGAESPVGDLSHDAVRPETESHLKNLAGSLSNKPTYGFKIALVSASRRGEQESEVKMVGCPVGERDGVPEGCSAVDDDIPLSKHQELSEKSGNESEAFKRPGGNSSAVLEDQMCAATAEAARIEALLESRSSESGSNPVCQDEKTVAPVSSREDVLDNEMEERETQDINFSDNTEQQEQFTEIDLADYKPCSTNKNLVDGEELTSMVNNDSKSDYVDASEMHGSVEDSMASPQEQNIASKIANKNVTKQLSTDREELSSMIDNDDRSEHMGEIAMESVTKTAYLMNSQEQESIAGETANGNDLKQHLAEKEDARRATDHNDKTDHIDETAIQESVTETISVTNFHELYEYYN